MVVDVDVGPVRLPVLVQAPNPELEELLHVEPPLRRHPVSEDVHQGLDVEGLREGLHAGGGLVEEPLRDEGLNGGGRGRGGGDRVAPVGGVERAPRGWIRGERRRRRGVRVRVGAGVWGGVGRFGELRLLREEGGGGDRFDGLRSGIVEGGEESSGPGEDRRLGRHGWELGGGGGRRYGAWKWWVAGGGFLGFLRVELRE